MLPKHDYLKKLKQNLTCIKNLPAGERLSFVWNYYKVAIVTLAAAVLLGLLVIGTLALTAAGVLRPRQSISLAVATDHLSDCRDWVSRFSDNSPGELPLDLLPSSGYAKGNAEFEVKLVCWIAAGQPDVLICDKATLEYCLSQGLLDDLAPCLPEGAEENTLWLDISDTAFSAAYSLDGSPLYLCRPLSGKADASSVTELVQAILIK